MRPRLRTSLALGLLAAAGCGTAPNNPPPVAKSLTAAQVQALPLEEAGDLSIRQNLAESPKRPILGKDTPTTTTSR